MKLVAGIVFVIFLSVFVELIAHGGDTAGAVQAFYYGKEQKAGGGFIGGVIAGALVEGFGLISAYVSTLVLLIICVILVTEKSLLHSADRARRNMKKHVDPNENRNARLARIEEDKVRQQNAAAVSEGPRRNRKISGVAFDTAVSPAEVPTKEVSSDELNEIHMSPDEQLNVKKV